MGNSGRVRPEEQLARWGARQHRQVTTGQLRAVGWSARVVSARVRQGRLHPVYAQVYSLGGPPQTDRERWMAATLSFGPGALLSHSSAAELYELLRFSMNEIHVTASTERRSRQGIISHHRTGGVPCRRVHGIPVTSPEQTILDCASTLRNDKAYRRIVRQAQVDELTTHARLLAFAALNAGQRGVARLRAELQAGPSPTRSGFEDEVLEVFRVGGEPLINHRIAPDLEVDLYWPALGLVMQVDGSPHDNPTAQADDAANTTRLQSRGLRVLRVR